MVVGVNRGHPEQSLPNLRYAENDARSIRDVLTDDTKGTFDEADVDLLIGSQASASGIKRTLRRRARETGESDLLLVYYAGHGYRPPWSRTSEVYLLTEDLLLDRLQDEPDAGLRMSFLRTDVFAEISGTSVFILDCCLAGNYLEPRLFSTAAPTLNPASHAALLACADNVNTRESSEVEHGEFTHAILEGLDGRAASLSGEVTLDSLHSWLTYQGRKPLADTRNYRAHIPLTRPGFGDSYMRQPPSGVRLASIEPVEHPLQTYVPSIRRLLDGLGEFAPGVSPDASPTVQRYQLETLRAALQAETVGVVKVSDRPDSAVWMDRWLDRADLERRWSEIVQLSHASIDAPDRLLARLGRTADGTRIYSVVLNNTASPSVAIVVAIDPSEELRVNDAPAAILIRQFLQPDVELPQPDAVSLELCLLSALRKHTGRLPQELYEQAFRLYKHEIEKLVLVFQQVVRLEETKGNAGINSYEALARRTLDDKAAPLDLLELATLWGKRFVVERDKILAGTAVRSYGELHHQHATGRTPLPVAVNVSPQSLMSPAYAQVLKGAMREARLNGAVTLEISEQDPIVVREEFAEAPDPTETFRRHLVKLVQDGLEVNFAIDDFGVGHSSLHRLASLSLAQIKIDRAILKHPLALEELGLVVKIANSTLQRGGAGRRPVILEGIDEKILKGMEEGPPLLLGDLYDVGIRYIQGYITGPPRTIDLRALEPEAEATIRRYWR